MARHERGVYEPSDEVRVFDGAEEDDDSEGSRLPLLILLALLVLAMFAGVVWMAYSEGVARGRTETPVLAAANGPARVAPSNPGGDNVQYQGFKIYEQPAPPDDEGDVAVSPPAPPPEQKLARETPPPAPVAPVQAAPRPAPQAVQPPPKPVAQVPVPKPVTQAAAPKPVAQTPASKPVTPPSATSTAATGAPRALPGIAAPAPAAQASAAPAAASGSFVLQIGAYKSQDDANAAWRTYKGRHAALLNGYGPDVQKADLGEKGTWYRLRIAGFSDRNVASALCDRLKADGGGCFLGK